MASGRKPGGGRLTNADLVALTVLTGGPAHGHAIWTKLDSHDVKAHPTSDQAEVSRAQVYYSLRKLARRKLIRSADDAERPDRMTWRITADGQRALTEALAEKRWSSQRAVSPFTTWVAMAIHAWPAVRQRVLRERRDFLDAEIARERETLEELRRTPSALEGVIVGRLMVEQAIQQLSLERDWLDELESALGS